MSEKELLVKKVAQSGRMIYGWGSVCKKRAEDGTLQQYRDADDEEFPEDVTEIAWREFMRGERALDAMHDEEQIGRVLYAFPLTEENAAAFGLADALDQTGVIVGAEVSDEVAAKFSSGELNGFSIGGSAVYEDIK